MAIYEGVDLTTLLESPNTPDGRRHYHAIDISESIWNRMEELGINQTQLAKMLGKSCSQVSRILSAQTNMTIQTLSELEHVLGITLADTTPYEGHTITEEAPEPYGTKPASEWDKKTTSFQVVLGGRQSAKKGWGTAA